MNRALPVVTLALFLAACGNSTGDRAASGAGIGAAAGAVVGAVTGLSIVEGVLIGAAAGGITGAVTDEDTINLGDPWWSDKSSNQANSGTARQPAAQQNAASSSPLVHEIQYGLDRLGYRPGAVDGEYGPNTEAAILRYQIDNGMIADGEPSRQVADHINAKLQG